MLQNLCPSMTSPTFSFPLTPSRISLSKNSSCLQTDNGTYSHSSLTPCSLRQNPVPFLTSPSLFHLSSLDPFRSSTGPSARWSPFHISYVFHFRFRSCSTSATQHQLSVLFLLSVSHHSLFPFLVGSAMWKPTLSLT